MNRRIVLAIARKDIVDAVRNLYVFGAIIMPLGFWLLFRLIFPDSGDLKIGAVAVYDQGGSALVERLAAEPVVDKVIKVGSYGELAEAVRKDAVGGLSLPAGFDEAVKAGETPEATLLVNGRRGGSELSAFRRLIDRQLRDLANWPAVANLVERDVNVAAPGSAQQGLGMQRFLFAVLLMMGLAMTGVFVVPMLLVEEKEKHTLKAILVSPASYADIVAGKAVVGLFYGLLGAGIMIVLYDALHGNVVLLAVAVALGTLVMVEAGLLEGALFSTSGQVNAWSSFFLVILILPSWITGSWVPVPVQTAVRFIPTYYLAQLLEQVNGSAFDIEVVVNLSVLAACAVVLFGGIVWTLKRAER